MMLVINACSLNKNRLSIENDLIKIEENEKEKPAIPCEANGVLKIRKWLETSFLSNFWGDILHRFNFVRKTSKHRRVKEIFAEGAQ